MPDKETGLALEKLTVLTNAAWSRLPICMCIKFNTEYASQITNGYNANSLAVWYAVFSNTIDVHERKNYWHLRYYCTGFYKLKWSSKCQLSQRFNVTWIQHEHHYTHWIIYSHKCHKQKFSIIFTFVKLGRRSVLEHWLFFCTFIWDKN